MTGYRDRAGQLGFPSVAHMNRVVPVSQVSNLCKYLCELSNELLTYTYIVM